MAKLSEIQAITRRYYLPVLVDQVYEKSPLLRRIFKVAEEGKFGMGVLSATGRDIVEPLEYQETGDVSGSHGAYDCDDTWSGDTTENITGAVYNWKQYHSTIKICLINLQKNTGAARMIDLAAIRFRAATKNLRKDIATDMYSTELGATKKIVGLRGITAQTGTLGNIDKATNAFWQGYNKAVGAALTWAHLNDAYVKTKKYGAGETPTIIVGSEGALQKYEDNYTKVDTGTHGVRYLVTPGKVLAGGFRAFSFKGTPFVSDPFCPSSTVFVLNENFLHARKLLEFVDTGWKSLEINGKDWVQNTIKGYFAFTCNMCKKQGYLSNVTEA